MSSVQRGGMTLKTGKIGRVNCLRQQMMMPGERMNISLKGQCRLESLRERDAMRIHAHLGVFMTPLRWLWSDFPNYLKEGHDTLITPPIVTGDSNWHRLGIGSWQSVAFNDYYEWYKTAYERVYNEWYKWPEDPDLNFSSSEIDGLKAVPLSKAWSRCRYDATPTDASDYTLASATDFDVRLLAEKQARFRSAMKRDVLSYNRWMELIEDVYKGDGSREVDQVPIMLDQTEVGVNPREIPATDGASLGQWQSLFDFQIDHQIRGVTAPEHCVLTYMLTVRFASVTESAHPLGCAKLTWPELVADPEFISSAQPREVTRDMLYQSSNANSFGYLPAGWQWRADSDVIGRRIDERDSFPYMEFPDTITQTKDATNVKDAFRSQALGDYLVDVFVSEDSRQPIGTAMDSYFSGMLDDATPSERNKNDEFPAGGKML